MSAHSDTTRDMGELCCRSPAINVAAAEDQRGEMLMTCQSRTTSSSCEDTVPTSQILTADAGSERGVVADGICPGEATTVGAGGSRTGADADRSMASKCLPLGCDASPAAVFVRSVALSSDWGLDAHQLNHRSSMTSATRPMTVKRRAVVTCMT